MTKAFRIAIAAMLIPVRIGPARADESQLPRFVGTEACLSCHVAAPISPGKKTDKAAGKEAAAEVIGHADRGKQRPCAVPTVPDHKNAYAALTTPIAAEVAMLSGIHDSPATAQICLACHATGADEGPRWWNPSFRLADGIQCEACHGAGSLHVAMHRGENHDNNTRDSIRPGARWQCEACHYDRPSHRMVLQEGFHRAPADRLYKTPVNLALSADGRLLFVPCEQSNSLIIVDTGAGQVVAEVPVGKRPHGVAIDPSRPRVYVTNRISNSLSVIDTASRNVVTEIAVGAEPHGVITDPAGRWIFVLNTAENTVSVVDAERLNEVRRLTAGRGPWSVALGGGGKVAYVTNVRPNLGRFRDPPDSEITVLDTRRAVVSQRLDAPETNMHQGVAFSAAKHVALFAMMRTKNLVPITRLAQGWTITNGIGVIRPDGRVDQVLLDTPNDYFPDPIGVAVSPDGHRAVVTSGGSNQVAVIDVDELLKTIESTPEPARSDVLPNHLGMSDMFVIRRIRVGTNPRAVVFAPDGRLAYVANALDDSISVIDMNTLDVTGTIELGGPAEISELRRGERIFHSADHTFGNQFSCRSCHPDGHTNGLTFDIEADGIGFHPVDNRSLRGILDTGPFKWEGTNPTLNRQCGPRLARYFTRLAPYTQDELTPLVRYMCTIEEPRNRYRDPHGLTEAQRRGKAVFERTRTNAGVPIALDGQCAFCHSGGLLTNRRTADAGTTLWFDAVVDADTNDLFNTEQYGELGNYYFIDSGTPTKAFDVAHLRNICDSPPYLHDGGAATLEEIWTRFNIVDRHGVSSDMTRQQLNDLIAYLKAL